MAEIRTILHEAYLEHRGLFHAVAISITRSRADAEDAIHTAFGKVLRAGRIPDHPKAYLVRAVRNCALDLRSRQDVPAVENMLEASTDPTYPDDTLDFLLGHLSENDREILVLKLVQGLSFREIGELTEHPAGSVATRYRRALQHLRTVSKNLPIR